VAAVISHGVQSVWRLRIEEARLRGGALGSEATGEVEALRTEVAELRRELDDVHERLDFAERVLLQNRDRQQLSGGRDGG
jgi:hypothetical protein